MDLLTLVQSNNSVEKIKCSCCANYLSYFPINIRITDQKNICGRCFSAANKNDYIHNGSLEILCDFLKFPCRYESEGCPAQLFPREIPGHENVCFYKIITCPTKAYSECNWEESRPNLLTHCQDQHSDRILKDGEFELDLTRTNQSTSLIIYDNTILELIKNYNPVTHKLQFSIHHIEEAINTVCYLYEIYLKSEKVSVHFESTVTSFHKKNVSEMYLDSLKTDSSISSIVSGKINLKNDEGALDENLLKMDLDLLFELTCTSCSNYVVPPIYQYGEKQKIMCVDCRQQNQEYNCCYYFKDNIHMNCNTCLITRNFNLDNLARLLYYPCRNKKNGCTFISKADQINPHEKICLYKIHDCPVKEYEKCEWKGLGKEIAPHIRSNHNDLLIQESSEISVCVITTVPRNRRSFRVSIQHAPNIVLEKCYFFEYSSRLFRLNFTIGSEKFHWEMQMIGQFADIFQYEISIINQNRILAGSQTCSTLTPKHQLYNNEYNSFSVHIDNIRSFLSPQNVITFKVRIFK